MSGLVDLSNEARAAVNDAIFAAGITVGGTVWPVYDTVPQGTQPPFLKIGTVETSDEGRPGEQFERLNVEVIGVYRGGDRADLAAAMFAARVAIDGKQLLTSTAIFTQCRFVAGSLSDASKEDGVTYAGLSSFELLGEPA